MTNIYLYICESCNTIQKQNTTLYIDRDFRPCNISQTLGCVMHTNAGHSFFEIVRFNIQCHNQNIKTVSSN